MSALLIRRGARVCFAYKGEFGYGLPSNTALHIALHQDLFSTATLLIKEFDMDPNLSIGREIAWTPLEWAVQTKDNAPFILELVQLGADVNFTHHPGHGSSALYSALETHRYNNAQALLQQGAKVGREIVTRFSLYCPSASASELRLLDTLIREHGVDINAPDSYNGKTPFAEQACSEGDEPLARFMLEHGADPNKRIGRNGDFPLAIVRFKTTYRVHARLVALLLDHGADPNCRINNNEEGTWLDYVRNCRNTGELEALLRMLRSRDLDLPWKKLTDRVHGPRYSTRAVPSY